MCAEGYLAVQCKGMIAQLWLQRAGCQANAGLVLDRVMPAAMGVRTTLLAAFAAPRYRLPLSTPALTGLLPVTVSTIEGGAPCPAAVVIMHALWHVQLPSPSCATPWQLQRSCTRATAAKRRYNANARNCHNAK